jgi:hypothetical protein
MFKTNNEIGELPKNSHIDYSNLEIEGNILIYITI